MILMTLELSTGGSIWGGKTISPGLYDSFIWTESFGEPGDFEISTSNIEEMRALFPKGKLVGISQTTTLMYVTRHEFSHDNEGKEVLIIKGEGFETFLNTRVFPAYGISIPQGPSERFGRARLREDHAALMIYTSAVSPPAVASVDQLPMSMISVYTPKDPGTYGTVDASYRSGPLYSQVQSILGDMISIRACRPSPTPLSNVMAITVNSSNNIVRNSITSHNGIRFEIFHQRGRRNGRWKQRSLMHIQGDIKSTRFVDDDAQFYTSAIVSSAGGLSEQVRVNVDRGAGPYSFYTHRVMHVDGGSYGDDITLSQRRNQNRAKGMDALKAAKSRMAMEAELTSVGVSRFASNFRLGDTLNVRSEINVQAPMLVSKYTRAWDKQTGYTEYPTLIYIGEPEDDVWD